MYVILSTLRTKKKEKPKNNRETNVKYPPREMKKKNKESAINKLQKPK